MKPPRVAANADRTPRLRTLHRVSAFLLGVFLVVHIANHLAGLAGENVHLTYMTAARRVYRAPLVEATLLAMVAWQMTSGALLLRRRWRARKGMVATLQLASGAVLLGFLAIHVGAVLAGRMAGIDTDFRFAAAGFHTHAWWLFFAPYYTLAVIALTTHVGCALYWRLDGRVRNAVLTGCIAGGTVAGVLISLMLAGVLARVDIPSSYGAFFGALFR
ncbi:MAG: hypothetical protein K2P70_04575 [Hyphomonadaceae bacterium]|nr:hypothetical protein [Hyphomonadaceae bacterium]